MALGLTFSSAVLLTFSVIGTLSGEFPAPTDVMDTLPIQVPGAPSALPATLTVITSGVVPLLGEAETKLPQALDPPCVATLTANGEPLLVTVKVCATAGLWNNSRLKTSAPWLALSDVEFVTMRNTV